MKIKIETGNLTLYAELNGSHTAKSIAAILPVEGRVNVWGNEIYFDIPVEIPLADDAVEEVAVGTLAYWPVGSALCIFFGPTPVSTGPMPRAYSPVNVFGRITGDAADLKAVASGARIIVSAHP